MSTGRPRFPSALLKMTEEDIAAVEEYCSPQRVALLERAVARMETHVKEQECELGAIEKLLRPKPQLYGVVEVRDTYTEAIEQLREAASALRAVLRNPVLFDTDANRHVIIHLERTERSISKLIRDLMRVNLTDSPSPPMTLSSENTTDDVTP
uniref:Cdc6_C domain-containing protein n=1 Tax=Steinernema glaseri TaxID=37863 RepID=A0A1I7YKU7_9BILA